MKKFDKNQKNTIIIQGDCFKELLKIEPKTIDCVITSPPYFQEREKNKHFNLNQSLDSYIDTLVEFSTLISNVLKDEGSFWLNIGDSYSHGSLQLIPSRVAIKLIENGWILNNDIIWCKSTSTPSSYKKRLTNSYEHLFHFVKNKDFYYNLTTLDAKKNKPVVENGIIKTSSNITGKNYHKLITSSTALTKEQKNNALVDLNKCLEEVKNGVIKDFRFLIKGNNKVNSYNRLEELNNNGYIIIKSIHNKPSDVWEILPEKNSKHYAPFPEELVELPINVTCPKNGIVLDPFCGSGTTNYVAMINGRNSIGIEIKEEFAKMAVERCK